MRNLTVKRTKSFVACVMTMKVYIEDPEAGDVTINQTPCRKLGDLKNGEEKTFPIDEQAAKVFVIADQLSKDYCNEYYDLPEGEEDVFLTGKNKLNPGAGNPFRFDSNDSAGIAENRKRGSRKGWVVFIGAVIVGLIVGFLISKSLLRLGEAEPKTFSSDGMTITLTDEFSEAELDNFTVSYESKEVAVFALKESFSEAAHLKSMSIEQYGNLVIQMNGLFSDALKKAEGLTYFDYEYENTETNETYRYFVYLYKTDDAFWMVQFALPEQNVKAYSEQITEWARAVTFSN